LTFACFGLLSFGLNPFWTVFAPIRFCVVLLGSTCSGTVTACKIRTVTGELVIIGLDLLTLWGALVDVSRNAIHLGMESLALRHRQGKKVGRTHVQLPPPVTVLPPSPPQLSPPPPPEVTTKPPGPPTTTATIHQTPTSDTVAAIQDLCQWSSEGLDSQQSQQLRDLLQQFTDIFAARDEECTQTNLVQHKIDTGTAPPIRLRLYRLALAKREAAERMILEMAAAGVIEPSNSPCPCHPGQKEG